jgi:hypothetical protein
LEIYIIAKLSPSPSFSSAELAVFSFSPTHPRESKELAAIGCNWLQLATK